MYIASPPITKSFSLRRQITDMWPALWPGVKARWIEPSPKRSKVRPKLA